MSETDQDQNRRRFLAQVAGASTLLAGATLADAAKAEKLAPPRVGSRAPAHGEWNLSWIDRLTRAKHKVVFDATEIAGGTALVNALFSLRDYGSVYQASDADMGVAVVVRHFALPMVFGDASWARFKLGESAKVKDPVTGDDSVRNPFVHPDPGQKTILPEAGAGIDTLIGRGVVVLCCNEALTHFAEMLGKQTNVSADEARQALIASLVPGALLVPSGIFGLARAGEAGCHYIRSS